MFESVLFGIMLVIVGAYIGWYLKSMAYDAQDWEVLRYNSKIFGYRPIQKGQTIHKGDKVFLALKIDTAKIDGDGYTLK